MKLLLLLLLARVGVPVGFGRLAQSSTFETVSEPGSRQRFKLSAFLRMALQEIVWRRIDRGTAGGHLRATRRRRGSATAHRATVGVGGGSARRAENPAETCTGVKTPSSSAAPFFRDHGRVPTRCWPLAWCSEWCCVACRRPLRGSPCRLAAARPASGVRTSVLLTSSEGSTGAGPATQTRLMQ